MTNSKLHMLCSHIVVACKHADHEYINYIHLVYTLESVSNVYRGLFGELRNEAYWPPCHEPMICPSLDKKINSKVRLVFFRIHIEIDIPNHLKKLPPPCRLKPTTYYLCHILCILNILLYCFKFKYFVLFLIILYIFCNLNILHSTCWLHIVLIKFWS